MLPKFLKFIFFFGSIIFSLHSAGQTKIELIKANTLEYDETKGTRTKKLRGNVIFKHENTFMFCDSADLFEQNNLEASGNIRINQGDTLFAYGDKLKFDGNTGVSELHDHVILKDNEMELTTNHLNFNTNTSIGNYYGGGNIITKDNVLTSDIGHYYSHSKDFFYKGNVRLVNPDYTILTDTLKYNTFNEISYFFGPTRIISDENVIYCENGWYDSKNERSKFSRNTKVNTDGQEIFTDSLIYDRKAGIGEAFRNVTMVDTSKNMIVKGDYSWFSDKQNMQLVTGKALFIQTDGSDSLFLHADTLKSISDTSGKERVLYAFHKVKFYREDMQGQCDSLVYDFKDSIIRLYNKPILWNGPNQLSGKHIAIKSSKGVVENLKIHEEAFITAIVDSSGFYNQVKGDSMDGIFFENRLDHIKVMRNSESIYYAKEDSGGYIGINKAEAKNMRINLKDEQIDKITFYINPKAILFPIREYNKKDFLLRGFLWEDKKRPKKMEDIFEW